MKKVLSAVACAAAIGWTGSAMAATYSFEDTIDKWGILQLDAAYISQSLPLSYTHNLNQEVNFAAGDKVLTASLELDFTNDLSDSYGQFIFRYDNREFVNVGFNGSTWVDIGEQDNSPYSMLLNIDWLNDDGKLDVTIKVSNPLGTATAWLDHSRLYGTAETAPVPEPTTMLLFGTGLLGLAAVGRRRKV